jgi:hypothetical protein
MNKKIVGFLVLAALIASNGASLNQRPRYRTAANEGIQTSSCTNYNDSTTALWIVTSDGCEQNWRRQDDYGDLCQQVTKEAIYQIKIKGLGWRMLDTTIGYRIGRNITDDFPLADLFREQLLEHNIKYVAILHDFGLEKWDETSSKVVRIVTGALSNGAFGAFMGAGAAGQDYDVKVYCKIFNIEDRTLALKFDCFAQYRSDKDYRNIVIKTFNTLLTKCSQK